MDGLNIATIIVAVVTALAALASGRAANKASVSNSKTDAEKEAYERARTMDVATIERQDREIEELREQNRLLRTENEELRIVKEQNGYLNADVKRVDRDNTRMHNENEELKLEVASLRDQIHELLKGNAIYVSSERVTPPVPRGVDTSPMMPEVSIDDAQAIPDLD